MDIQYQHQYPPTNQHDLQEHFHRGSRSGVASGVAVRWRRWSGAGRRVGWTAGLGSQNACLKPKYIEILHGSLKLTNRIREPVLIGWQVGGPGDGKQATLSILYRETDYLTFMESKRSRMENP